MYVRIPEVLCAVVASELHLNVLPRAETFQHARFLHLERVREVPHIVARHLNVGSQKWGHESEKKEETTEKITARGSWGKVSKYHSLGGGGGGKGKKKKNKKQKKLRGD